VADWKKAARFLRAHWPRIVLSVLLLAVFFGNQGFRSLVSNWIELKHLRTEIGDLRQKQGQLSQEMKLMQPGQAPFERVIRRDLGWVKKGEIEYRFPPPAQSSK